MASETKKRWWRHWKKIVLGVILSGVIAIILCLVIVIFFPQVAAQNIDRLRDIIGDAPVAQLEAIVLNIQDQAKQWMYQRGLVKPAAPWGDSDAVIAQIPPTSSQPTKVHPTSPTASRSPDPTARSNAVARPKPTVTPPPTLTLTHKMEQSSCLVWKPGETIYATQQANFILTINRDPKDTITAYDWFVNGTSIGGAGSYVFPTSGHYTIRAVVSLQSGQTPACEVNVDVQDPLAGMITSTETSVAPTLTFTPTDSPPTLAPQQSDPPTATPQASAKAWQLQPLTPMGKLSGEGVWTPYMQTADGQTVLAYRTFLQPDPLRPYSVAAIVAFNLQVTRLHFVLGTEEPKPAKVQPSRTGTIPATDFQAGILLATFNGGFKARHGKYGAMADGLVALPAIAGLGTVAMYGDGRVQIGEWGTDITDSPDLLAWRQNGLLLIHNGQINPATSKTTLSWGLTLKGDAITWRSALGLSPDGILYYIAGTELDVATLAKVVMETGATNAMQLDINNYWVHFTAISSNGSDLQAAPLLKGMNSEVDRYLKAYSRDFFYVTAASGS
jgi:hypothetical protein